MSQRREFGMLELVTVVSCVSMLVSVFALWRTFTPPQRKEVAELSLRVADVEHVQTELVERMRVRAKSDSAADARAVRAAKRSRDQELADEARQLIEQQQRKPREDELPDDPEAARAALRAKIGLH